MDNKALQEFWAQKEEQLGETILEKGLVHLLRSRAEQVPDDSWCLAWLTETSFFIQSGGSSNWFQKLTENTSSKKEEDWPLLTIKRADIRSIEAVRGQGKLARLFNQPFTYRIFWEGEEQREDCTLEMDSMNLIQLLL